MNSKRVKWGILLSTLPLTALFCLAKFTFHRLGWEPWEFDSMTSTLLGAATFVIAFVLSGTLSDYRTSEDLPTQISNSIEAIEDSNRVLAFNHTEYDPQPVRAGLLKVLQTLKAWLESNTDINEVYAAIAQLNIPFSVIGELGGLAVLNRVQTEQARLRLSLTQMRLVRDTDFIAPAYAMLELFTVGSVVALLLIQATNFGESLVISGLIFTAFTYLVLLIRDLDNPFQYNKKSSADVELYALDWAIARLSDSVTSANQPESTPVVSAK